MNPENFDGTPEYYNKQNTNKEKIHCSRVEASSGSNE